MLRPIGCLLLLSFLGMGQDAASPGMLRQYLRRIAFDQLAARKDRIAQVQTREQAEARKLEVRKQFISMLGGLPTGRTPLNIRRVGVVERPDYRIEKIIYESLPKFYVTANLYVPKTGKPPYPAVLQPTGHSVAAKARAFYQNLGLGLVKNGFVVITYDPTGQGERRNFYDPSLGDSKVGASTTIEHEMVGIQSLLAGESIARYMVWDGIRSIDVLQSLPYVDPKRIGISGCSGGGTLTAYIALLDDRLQVAAPSCYITDWETQLLGAGPQDAEQQFPDELKNGFDHADFVEAFAPKPYLIASTTEDFFPIAGSRAAFAESRRVYALYGAGDRITTSYDTGPHGTTRSQREAIYAWMNRWLNGGDGRIRTEPPFETEYEEDLLCTTTGQLSTSLGGETASTMNIKRYSRISPQRPAVTGIASLQAFRAQLRQTIVELTRYSQSKGPLNIHAAAATQSNGNTTTDLTYETGPGRIIPATLIQPESGHAAAAPVLYLDEHGIASAAKRGGDIERLTQLGHTVLAIDPSGIGSTMASWPGDSASWFGKNENTTWLALMVGRPLTGLRIDDILRAIDLLDSKGILRNGKVFAVAKGTVGADLLHAAVLDERIEGVLVEQGLISYASVTTTPIHRQIFDIVIPGVLGKYDLPELAAAIAPRRVSLVNLRDPVGKNVFLRDLKSAYQYATTAYRAAGAPENLVFALRRETDSIETFLTDTSKRAAGGVSGR